jgi:hypothetical protein
MYNVWIMTITRWCPWYRAVVLLTRMPVIFISTTKQAMRIKSPSDTIIPIHVMTVQAIEVLLTTWRSKLTDA